MTRGLTAGPVSGLTSNALSLLETWGPPFDESLLLSLAQRASLESGPPHPYVRARSLDLIMRGHREDTLPDALRQRLLDLLSHDGHAMEETVAMLHFLLDPPAGLARLGRALRHEIPLVSEEVAACLVVIGTPDALALLSTTENDEAQLALGLARGDEPAPRPEPTGETILWRGQPRQVYTFDELMASRLPTAMRHAIEQARETWGPRLARWWAS